MSTAAPRPRQLTPTGGQLATVEATELTSSPILEEHDTGGTGTVFANRYATVEMVPSRYGPFTTFRAGNGGGAAVLVVRGGRIMLVCQPRYAVGQNMWELPRGGNQPGESNFEAGVREVAEETGVRVDPRHVIGLGPIVPDSGVVSTTAGLLLARLPSTSAQLPVGADGEVDSVRWVPADDVVDACVDGTISDAFTCVAVLRARLLGLI